MAKAHGAAMTDAAIREEASICDNTNKTQKMTFEFTGFFFFSIFLTMLHLTPNEMNAPMTLPAMVAKPPVITV